MSANKKLCQQKSKQLEALQNLMNVSQNANILFNEPNPEHPWHTPQFIIRKKQSKAQTNQTLNKNSIGSPSSSKANEKKKRHILQKSPTRMSNNRFVHSSQTSRNKSHLPTNINIGLSVNIANMNLDSCVVGQNLRKYSMDERVSNREGERQYRKFFATRQQLGEMKGNNQQRKPISYSRYLKQHKKQMRFSLKMPCFNDLI